MSESDELQLVNPTEEILGEACNRCEEKVICSTVLRMKFGFRFLAQLSKLNVLDFGTEFRLSYQ